MLVLLDIGNTSVTSARYHGGRLLLRKSLNHTEVPDFVLRSHKSGGQKATDVVFSSVVPEISRFIRKKAGSRPFIRLLEAGKDLPLQIKHKYRSKKKLGVDRQVNIYGALRIYGAPMLVIDFGTAIKADFLSSAGVFEGGMILPGPELAFQALLSRAARLPKRARLPRRASSFIGRDTTACMKSGILQGYGAMTDGLIERFRSRYGRDLRVLLTGGFAGVLKPVMEAPNTVVDPSHSMKSLLLLYKASQKA